MNTQPDIRPDYDPRNAIAALLTHGTWTDPNDLVVYHFTYEDGRASGEMHAPDGSHGYHFRGNLESQAPFAVLGWLLKRIDKGALLSSDLVIHNAKTACPFCGQTATCAWNGQWHGCEHFAGSLRESASLEFAYYVADSDEFFLCDRCEHYTHEDARSSGECDHCGADPVAYRGPDRSEDD